MLAWTPVTLMKRRRTLRFCCLKCTSSQSFLSTVQKNKSNLILCVNEWGKRVRDEVVYTGESRAEMRKGQTGRSLQWCHESDLSILFDTMSHDSAEYKPDPVTSRHTFYCHLYLSAIDLPLIISLLPWYPWCFSNSIIARYKILQDVLLQSIKKLLKVTQKLFMSEIIVGL